MQAGTSSPPLANDQEEKPKDEAQDEETSNIADNCEHMMDFIRGIEERGISNLSKKSKDIIAHVKKEMKKFVEDGVETEKKPKKKKKAAETDTSSDIDSSGSSDEGDKQTQAKKGAIRKTTKERIKKEYIYDSDSSDTSEREIEDLNDVSDVVILKRLIASLDNRSMPSQAPFDEESGQDLAVYLERFENYCKQSFKGGKYLWVKELEKNLKGRTLAGFHSVVKVNNSYRNVKENLLSWYKEEKQARKAKARGKFERAKPKSGESYFIYSGRLENLFTVAFPKHSIETSQTLLYKFKNSVSKSLKEAINSQILSYKLKDKRVPWKIVQKCARLYDLERNLEEGNNSSNDSTDEVVINLSGAAQRQQNIVDNTWQNYKKPYAKPQQAYRKPWLNDQNAKVQVNYNTGQPRYQFSSRPPALFQRPPPLPFPPPFQSRLPRMNSGFNRPEFRPRLTRPSSRFMRPPSHLQNSICEACGRFGHSRDRCRKLLGACFLCGRQGHFIRDCHKRYNNMRFYNEQNNVSQNGGDQFIPTRNRSFSTSYDNGSNFERPKRSNSQQNLNRNGDDSGGDRNLN